MRRILKEPLLHFAVLGIGLFALFRLTAGEEPPASEEIVVDAARIAALAQGFERSWRRPPSADEVDGLVASYVRDEVLYREGLARGLDRDDSVIRNRVLVKMEVLGELPETELTDLDVHAWFDANAERYAKPARYDVRQVYFDPVRRGSRVDSDVGAALRELERNPALDPTTFGDATLLPAELDDVTRMDVASQYGEEVAALLTNAPAGGWLGPVGSSYGVHLVRVDVREPPRAAVLADVRDAVERDVRSERAQRASEALYLRLRER
ncbi:MAG TPA: peptidylprolyl isomerase, partial [Gammaproteobacteria bacterium]